MPWRIILTNAFSLNMLPRGFSGALRVREVSLREARDILSQGFTSAVGHEQTARLFGEVLGLPVEANRANVELDWDTALVVGQYRGPRLPEGSTTLPGGAEIVWYLVHMHEEKFVPGR